MPRSARQVVPNRPHHITQRAIRRMPMFHSEKDKEKYIEHLKAAKDEYGLEVYSYCLMDNHVHLLVVPRDEDSLAKTIRNAHSRYSRYFNALHGYVGHLLQSRFFSCPMDDRYMWHTIRYVERNPVAANLAKHASEYRWSSAPYRCGLADDDPLVTKSLPDHGVVDDWYTWLQGEDADVSRKIMNATAEGSWLGHRAPSP